MFVLCTSEIDSLRRAVLAAFPREASGILMREDSDAGTLLSLRTTGHDENTPMSFVIRSDALRSVATSLAGTNKKICGCVHSHVVGRAWPSRRDSAGAKAAGELWLIYSLTARSLRLFEWDGTTFQRWPLRVVTRRPRAFTAAVRSDVQLGCKDCRGGGDCAGCSER